METESVRSGRSDRSGGSQMVPHRHHQRSSHGSRKGQGHRSNRSSDSECHRLRRHGDRDTDPDTDRDDRSVSTRASRRVRHGLASEFIPEGRSTSAADYIRGRSAVQDDDWGENTTVVTGATSDVGFSMEDVRGGGGGAGVGGKDLEGNMNFRCARYIGLMLASLLSFAAFLSPVAMIVLPKIGFLDWSTDTCKPDCEGHLLGLGFKLLILLIGSWALFFRRPKATLPRLNLLRSIVLFLIFVVTFAYWLFYGVRIYRKENVRYVAIVSFAGSLVDALLFIHYLAVILLELRQVQPQYVVKITRSPDGESRSYNVGQLTIQSLAVWCLEQYYKDFQVYNPYLENVTRRVARVTGFKIYDVDGVAGSVPAGGGAMGILADASAGQRETGHNDRFYEEQEYERRVRRRRMRLIVATEEAFAHVKRSDREPGAMSGMSPDEAAQAIFPTLVRPLQKYLRITRQQPRYTMENVLRHLAICISHEMSSKAFLERYLSQGAVIWNDKGLTDTQTWVIICDRHLSRAIDDGIILQLRQGPDVNLLITIRRLPHFNLVEQVFSEKMNKFVLRLNSEMSV